jgi:DNA-binding NarL/FixJ family response regulator
MIRSGLAQMVSAEPDLEAAGTAADGARAVELSEREHPDIVLLDLSMPELRPPHGREAAAAKVTPHSRAGVVLTPAGGGVGRWAVAPRR